MRMLSNHTLYMQAIAATQASPSAREGARVARAIALAARILEGLPNVRSLCITEPQWFDAFASLAKQLTAETEHCLASCSPALAVVQADCKAQAELGDGGQADLQLTPHAWHSAAASLQQWAASVERQLPVWITAAAAKAKGREGPVSAALLAQLHEAGFSGVLSPAAAARTAEEIHLLLELLHGPSGQAALVEWGGCILTEILGKLPMQSSMSGKSAGPPASWPMFGGAADGTSGSAPQEQASRNGGGASPGRGIDGGGDSSGSSTNHEPAPTVDVASAADEDFRWQRIFYATDRALQSLPDKNGVMANPLGFEPSDGCHSFYGPGPGRSRTVEYGSVEAWMRDHGAADAHPMAKHVQLSNVQPEPDAQLPPGLVRALADPESGTLLLYIHGYANSFGCALSRNAQLRRALRHRGPVLCFSWPSCGVMTRAAYGTDGASAAASQRTFWRLLRDLAHAVSLAMCTRSFLASLPIKMVSLHAMSG